MAANTNGSVILLPLYPKYARAVMAGTKTVEFRKANVPRNVTHVVVYATAPEKMILGYFSVKRTVVASPAVLWRRFARRGRVEQKDFQIYYRGADLGVAIIVDSVYRYIRPMAADLNGALRPIPQSFKYVSRFEWRRFSLRKSQSPSDSMLALLGKESAFPNTCAAKHRPSMPRRRTRGGNKTSG